MLITAGVGWWGGIINNNANSNNAGNNNAGFNYAQQRGGVCEALCNSRIGPNKEGRRGATSRPRGAREQPRGDQEVTGGARRGRVPERGSFWQAFGPVFFREIYRIGPNK